ncbi:MAG: allophanate hydrolase, partial [Pseudomonadota bacterium]
QLTELGGRFVRHARTAPAYRFYALAGGPPARPGLVRTASPGGASIALEVWSLPKATVGTFIEGIPAPLGIGSVALSDGTQVKGFICEASGAEGGTDITHLGDWRVFLEKVPA